MTAGAFDQYGDARPEKLKADSAYAVTLNTAEVMEQPKLFVTITV